MNENNEFTPKVIGLPDTKKEQQIIELYSTICYVASCIVTNLQYYFESPHFEIKEVFDFVKSNEPKTWLYSKFIKYHNLTFPGMDIDRIIKLELVSIPEDYLQETMSLREKFIAAISKANELRFYFPLIKLLHESEEDDCRDFAISHQFPYTFASPEFDSALYNHIRKFTKSEKENEVLRVVENAVNALNDLVQIGIIRNDKQRWEIDLDNLIRAIVFNLKSEKPFSIHPDLPNFKGFGKDFEVRRRGAVTGQPGDILRFEEPAPVQFDELPENLIHPEDLKEEQVAGSMEDSLQTEDPEIEQTEANHEEVIQTE